MEDVHYDNITLSETVRQAVTRRSSLTLQSQRALTQEDSEAAEELDLCMNYLFETALCGEQCTLLGFGGFQSRHSCSAKSMTAAHSQRLTEIARL